ncbi:GntR family transcriptional regulator [bacterium]|nr:MAG: GntR family transcriptional regulator [bacterium]
MAQSKTERLPLYKKVTNQLREQCFASAGEMLPPLRQLSQMLDVNHATISRALRDLEQEGLVEIVPRKGIFSVPQHTNNANIELVVFVSEHSNLLDVALRIAGGAQSACRKLSATQGKMSVNRSVLAVPPFPEVDRFVGDLKSRGTVGIICLGFGFFEGDMAAEEEEFLAQVAQKIPVVLVGSPQPEMGLDCVYGDPRAQMLEFLEDCYSKGLRRFEYMGEHDDNLSQLERRACFARFMEEKGLDWEWNEFKSHETPELAAQLNSLPHFPEVVVATNVRRALTVALEAQRRGLKLPEELHILCFASLLEHAQPLLPYASVIMMDEPEVGARAVQLLHGKSASESNGEPVVERVPAHFISGSLHSVEDPLEPVIA